MLILILNFVISITISFILIKYFLINLVEFSSRKNLKQEKERWGNSNKSHLGGIAFTLPAIIIIGVYIINNNIQDYDNELIRSLNPFFLIIIICTIAGILDEKVSLGPLHQFLIQLLIAFILIWSDCIINISPSVTFNMIFTIFWIVALINALNLYDNVDSALGSYTLTIFSFFLIVGLRNSIDPNFLVIIIIYMGAIISFLYFNRYPSKIFMGEVGSLQISSILAGISIHVFWGNFEYSSFFDSIYYLLLNNLIFLVVITDTLIIFLVRLKNKKNPFRGDKNHLSHMVMKLGLNPNHFSVVVLIFNFFLVVFYFSIVKQQISIENTSLLFAVYLIVTSSLSLIYYFGKIR